MNAIRSSLQINDQCLRSGPSLLTLNFANRFCLRCLLAAGWCLITHSTCISSNSAMKIPEQYVKYVQS